MSVDLSQFHQVFFEESFEGLDIMESALMELDPEAMDSETINAIFRSAHSIKGGSATFGFTSIAEFTHVLETLLDEIREGKRQITTEHIDLFLKSIDCMKEMLTLLQGGDDGFTSQSNELKEKFTAFLNNDKQSDDGQIDKKQVANTESRPIGWKIHFEPNTDIMQSGNDPLRIIRELTGLGPCRVNHSWKSDLAFSDFNGEECHSIWDIELTGDVSKDDVDEVFAWVDESKIVIEPVLEDSAASSGNGFQRDNIVGWNIVFSPKTDLLRTGNCPLKIISLLKEKGSFHCESILDKLPTLSDIDPESCYLSWRIRLEDTDASKKDVLELFEWVDDLADIALTPIVTKSSETIDSASAGRNKAASPQKSDAGATKSKGGGTTSIRVGIDKIDSLINMVGELVITQSMLGQLGTEFKEEHIPKLLEGLGQLEQNTRELQESVMRIRMLPISFIFSRFPRMVRDLSQSLGKDINLVMLGEQTELDKTVMEKVGDPLVHLVRNSVDHGIETADARLASGKSDVGTITLNAFHQGGNVVIEVKDDGKGLDPDKIAEKAVAKNIISQPEIKNYSQEQIYDLIFHPGFSTAEQVTDVSGRGVGMDVVRKNIQALNGSVELKSEKGVGSTVTIRLPLTLAILDGQLVRVGEETYVIPLTSIVESMQCENEFVSKVADGCDVFRLRGEYVPIVSLSEVFGMNNRLDSSDKPLLVVVESEGEKVGIVVDELLAQQQVVIKSLEENYKRIEGISGATILGNGTVALIVDIAGVVRLAGEGFKIAQQNMKGIAVG